MKWKKYSFISCSSSSSSSLNFEIELKTKLLGSKESENRISGIKQTRKLNISIQTNPKTDLLGSFCTRKPNYWVRFEPQNWIVEFILNPKIGFLGSISWVCDFKVLIRVLNFRVRFQYLVKNLKMKNMKNKMTIRGMVKLLF